TYYSIAPKELLSGYTVLEGEDCVYDVNNYCSVPEYWTTWTISVLAKVFWKNRRPYAESLNLPHVIPNVIANLPEPDSIPDLSFSHVLREDVASISKASFVAIGNGVRQ